MQNNTSWSRRSYLALPAKIAAAGLAAPMLASCSTTNASSTRKLADLSASQAIASMTTGAFTAEAYAKALLEQCAHYSALNAFISIEPEPVLQAAREADRRRAASEPLGPLHGLPICVKDSVNTHDLPTTSGAKALRGWHPAADAPCVQKLKQAGAIILGKNNLHELQWWFTSDNPVFGTVHNPYDPARIPGGSSGGTAAAVAARLAPLGVAEDTRGSIRVPAALCGVYGFRPTTGRYPNRGVAPGVPLFDQIGPHARTVADICLFDTVMSDDPRLIRPVPLQGVRIGIARNYYFAGLDSEVARITEAALQHLRDAGVVIVEAELPGLDDLLAKVRAPIAIHDTAPPLASYLKEFNAPVTLEQLIAEASPDIADFFREYCLPGAPKAISEGIYNEARDVYRPQLQQLFAAYFADQRVSAILFPVTMVPATKIQETDVVQIAGTEVPFGTAIGRNITPGSTCGLPGLVLPAGLITRERLPVAIELDGPAGSDRDLLSLGLAIESVLGAIPAPTP